MKTLTSLLMVAGLSLAGHRPAPLPAKPLIVAINPVTGPVTFGNLIEAEDEMPGLVWELGTLQGYDSFQISVMAGETLYYYKIGSRLVRIPIDD
jgi:hypothetical protein